MAEEKPNLTLISIRLISVCKYLCVCVCAHLWVCVDIPTGNTIIYINVLWRKGCCV